MIARVEQLWDQNRRQRIGVRSEEALDLPENAHSFVSPTSSFDSAHRTWIRNREKRHIVVLPWLCSLASASVCRQ